MNKSLLLFFHLILILLMAGCASDGLFEEGQRLSKEGKTEEALAKYEAAVKQDPGNSQYISTYHRQRELAINQWLAQADLNRAAGQSQAAEDLYKRVLSIHKTNSRAQAGLDAIQKDRQHRETIIHAEESFKKNDLAGAEAKVRAVLRDNPSHREARALLRRMEDLQAKNLNTFPSLKLGNDKPITLEFRDANLRTIFEIISRHASVNFVFDRDVRPDLKATIFVKNAKMDDVMRMLLVTNQLDRKVLNENTVLIYPNTPLKQRDYQDLVVRSFYLANADVKQTLNMIKTMVKTKDAFVDEKLNLLIIRDTPDAVRMAEKLIAAQDLAEPEVMLELEVLEISSRKITDLGINYPSQLSVSFLGSGAGGVTGKYSLSDWKNRDGSFYQLAITDPVLILKLRKTEDSTNTLANPRIRVKNREKAKIHIGDRLPVITTTVATTGGFASTSVNYLDVGLKLDIEPNIYLEDEVAIKVSLEVSTAKPVTSGSGTSETLTYQVGTRNTSTVLRLKDGETQILGGLISDDDRKSASKVPGLGDIPLLGRLFGSQNNDRTKNEIVLLVTPRIVRNINRPDSQVIEFSGGTEAATGAAPLLLRAEPVSPVTTPSQTASQPAPAQPVQAVPTEAAPSPNSLPNVVPAPTSQ